MKNWLTAATKALCMEARLPPTGRHAIAACGVLHPQEAGIFLSFFSMGVRLAADFSVLPHPHLSVSAEYSRPSQASSRCTGK